MKHPWWILAAVPLLAACGEQAQTAGHAAAEQAWRGPATAYTAAGWQVGDETSWQAQMRRRAQGQNEYSRSGSLP
ncbi:MAG: hypothetical protein KGN16_04335 [Burkholderiales bacterium]|nr:hypothetical protein [Burkholderiales bacterium]